MTILRRIYSAYAMIVNNKRHFSLDASIEMFTLAKSVSKLHPLGKMLVVSDKEIAACWGLSKLTVKDLERDFGRTQHMVFVEFLEFICRVTHVAGWAEVDKKRVAMIYARRLEEGGPQSEDEEDANFVAPENSDGSDDADE